MAKVGLDGGGQDAARNAGQDAARETLAALLAGDVPPEEKRKIAEAGAWKVPDLPHDFVLERAVAGAMRHAANYLNYRMQGEGVVVELQQQADQTQALLREGGTANVLRQYGESEILRLYAAQATGGRGVVVDGKV